jgi:putative ATPase
VTVYLATLPKSNACYVVIRRALDDVRSKRLSPIPLHLRNAPHPALKEMGHAEGSAPQPYMPEGAWRLPYYEPTDRGHEARIRTFLERIETLKQQRLERL